MFAAPEAPFSADPKTTPMPDRPPTRSGRQRRMLALSYVIAIWIFATDLLWQQIIAVLYVLPLLLTTFSGNPKSVLRAAGWFVLLNYAGYFIKNTIAPPADQSVFDFRLVNRTILAATLVVMGSVLRSWMMWKREQADPEVPAAFKDQDREIGETLAILCCAPLILAIAVIDFLAPANYNIAILYPVPLFICAWTRSRWLPWAMLAVLLVLTVAAFTLGRASTWQGDEFELFKNRLLAVIGMVAVTAFLTSVPREPVPSL